MQIGYMDGTFMILKASNNQGFVDARPLVSCSE